MDGAGEAPGAVTRKRLDDQIAWYDKKSQQNQSRYKGVKVAEIVIAAFIPVLAAAAVPAVVMGGAGAVIVVLEGLQQLFQYQPNWANYRATCEALKHERFLFAAQAGPYASAVRPEALLAERVEGLVSQEHARWVSSQEEQGRRGERPAEVGAK